MDFVNESKVFGIMGNISIEVFFVFADAYMFGGYNGEQMFNDVWRLDMEEMQWKQLSCNLPKSAYFIDLDFCTIQTAH